MRRAVLARGDYFVDIFLVDAERERRIDWIFRNRGVLAPLGDGVPIVPAVLEGDGYEYIDDLSTRPAYGNIALNWQFGETGVKLFLAEMDGTSSLCGAGAGKPGGGSAGPVDPPTNCVAYGLYQRMSCLPG